MMAPPAQATPPPPPPSQQLFSASTDATQPLPSVSTSSSGARRQLSIADGKRLLEQYRRLKAQALAGPRVLAQLEGTAAEHVLGRRRRDRAYSRRRPYFNEDEAAGAPRFL